MEKVAFCDGWQFCRLGQEDTLCPVTLPHDAMLAEPRTGESPGGINTGWFEGHDYLYSKTFTLPADDEGKDIFLEFEGVYHNAEVYLNGEKAAFRPYGYSGFLVKADGLLHCGAENRVRVIARNADQPNSRWYSGAGIYRPVWLYTARPQHIKHGGLRVCATGLTPAGAKVTVETTCPGVVTVEFIALAGNALACRSFPTCGAVTAEIAVPGAKPWSCEEPHLYLCRATFAPDEGSSPWDSAETAFGFRTLTWSREEGLAINGRRVILRGACIHHDNGLLGACCHPDAEERKVRILWENGFNAIRSAHNPCSKALLDACDRLGMLVMDEFVDCWYIHKTQNDYASYFDAWWQQDLHDMVEKDYNHPSVIMYSTGNEVSETAQERGIALTGEMTRYLHSLDSTRPVTCGINIFFNLLSSMGLGVYSDEKAGKEAAPKKKSVGSEFYNNLAGLLGDKTMKLGATLHGCDVKTRGAFANMDIAGYNYGILRYRSDLKKYPDRLILGTETFCRDAYAFWEAAQRNPRVIGDFVWAGMDYLGEVGIGAWEYADDAPAFDHGPGWISAGSGRIDLTGLPLAEAAYMKTAFGLSERPIIAVQPMCHKGRHSPSAWKMTNARESWSWHGCAGIAATVEVYARAHSAVLFVNGRRVGKKRIQKDCRVLFRTPYRDGEVSVITYDKDGRESGRSALRTAGAETVLHALPEKSAVAPNGLSYIRLCYTDHTGIGKPMERHNIRIAVEGGTLLALGNACPYNAQGYLGHSTDTYYGEALAIVRAGAGGAIVLRADDGVREALARIGIEEGRNQC